MDIKLLRARKARETKILNFELALEHATRVGTPEDVEALKYIHSLEDKLFELQTPVLLDTEKSDKLIILLLVNGFNASDESTRSKAIEILLKKSLPNTITTPFALNYKQLGISGFKATVPFEMSKAFLRMAKQSSELLVQVQLKTYFNFIPADSAECVYNGFFFEVCNFKAPTP
jgi:hypothetical protein